MVRHDAEERSGGAAAAVAEKPAPAKSEEPRAEIEITIDRPGYIVPRGERCRVSLSRAFRWHEEGVARLVDAALLERYEREKRERAETLERSILAEEKRRRD